MSLARLTVVLLLLAPFAVRAEDLVRFERSELHMGVQFRIVLYASDEKSAAEGFQAAFARVSQLNGILSDYDPESELSRLGRTSPHEKPVLVSDDLWRVLAQAQAISKASDGAFDITLGPLTKLWRKSRKEKKLPSDEELAAARAAAGWRFVELDEQQKAVRLTKPNMRLDAGGIAKGYQEARPAAGPRGRQRRHGRGGGAAG
jgi:thiamine biosynthesis lipoprotein